MVMNPWPRYEAQRFPIQEEAYVEVYFRNDRLGRAPCASLYVHGVELVRYDCFPDDEAHMHIDCAYVNGKRIYYPPGKIADHIERTIWELRKNTKFATLCSADERIRELTLDPESLEAVSQKVEEELLDIVSRHNLT